MRWPAAACRARSDAASSTRRRRRTARSRRPRCSPASAATICALVAVDDEYAMRADALDGHGRPRPRQGRPALRDRRHGRHDHDDGHRPGRSDRRGRAAPWPLAPRRRRDGGLRDDPARMPLDLGGDRGRRLARGQRAQMARRAVRLLALLRARPRASRAGDVDQPELPAIVGRRPGQELPRLGHPARPPFPRAEALVPDPRTGRQRPAEAPAPRPGQCALARRHSRRDTWLARACAGSVADRLRPPRAAGLEGEALDAHTTAWAEAVNRSGRAYLTPAVLDGRWIARVSIGALSTEEADVAAIWAAMREAAEGSTAISGKGVGT